MEKEPSAVNENSLPNAKNGPEKQTACERLLTIVPDFLREKGEAILHQEISEDGFSFETERGKFFIPAYSFAFIGGHPELLVAAGVAWTEIDTIGNSRSTGRYFSGSLEDGSEKINLFRKDSSTKNRTSELQMDFPLQESRNSVHLGGGKPIAVSERISFRVPEHFATTPHGVIMEYLSQKDVAKFIKDIDEQDAKIISDAYRELGNFLWKHNKYKVFWIPADPLEGYQMAERMVFVESYDKSSGKVQFIITDLKNRNEKVEWDKK